MLLRKTVIRNNVIRNFVIRNLVPVPYMCVFVWWGVWAQGGILNHFFGLGNAKRNQCTALSTSFYHCYNLLLRKNILGTLYLHSSRYPIFSNQAFFINTPYEKIDCFWNMSKRLAHCASKSLNRYLLEKVKEGVSEVSRKNKKGGCYHPRW